MGVGWVVSGGVGHSGRAAVESRFACWMMMVHKKRLCRLWMRCDRCTTSWWVRGGRRWSVGVMVSRCPSDGVDASCPGLRQQNASRRTGFRLHQRVLYGEGLVSGIAQKQQVGAARATQGILHFGRRDRLHRLHGVMDRFFHFVHPVVVIPRFGRFRFHNGVCDTLLMLLLLLLLLMLKLLLLKLH